MKNSGKFKDDVDELFQLPLSEFIGARNTLAARLKQSGRADDANLVKTLAKPSVSAWTVNQLYWFHRDAFEELLAAGHRFHKAQTSSLAGKVADMRGALDARREALTQLADLAASVLSEAGHNPGPETIRRVTTTLEAISAHASVSDGPALGRLTQDVDPPGFESLASFVLGAGAVKATKSQPPKAVEERRIEQDRQTRIAGAKLAVQNAKKLLAAAEAKAQNLEATQKKAYVEAKQAEKELREAEQRFKKARTASEAAAHYSQTIAQETAAAKTALETARRTVDKATKELELLFATR